MKILSFHFT